MQFTPQKISDVVLIEPKVFGDDRGFFFESFHQQKFEQAVGNPVSFVQDNHSLSNRNVLRGLHYQFPHPQGKLVRVVHGEILDIALDIRRSSPTFGQSVSVVLSANNKKQLWIPEGFAHGFLTLSETAEVLYKATEYYHPNDEHVLLWNDPAVQIDWRLAGVDPIVSKKDAAGLPLSQTILFD